MEVEPPGSARLELIDGDALLRPEDAVLEAMLAGWATCWTSWAVRMDELIEPIPAAPARCAAAAAIPHHQGVRAAPVTQVWAPGVRLGQAWGISTSRPVTDRDRAEIVR